MLRFLEILGLIKINLFEAIGGLDGRLYKPFVVVISNVHKLRAYIIVNSSLL